MLGSSRVEVRQWGWGSWECDFGCEGSEGAAGGHCGQRMAGKQEDLISCSVFSKLKITT